MKRTLWKLICAIILALGLIASSGVPAFAEKGSPGRDVQQLSNRVEKLIKEVEGSTLACETRNSVVRKLRALDDALRSGNRSAARALVEAWRQHAWSLQASRLISPELGSRVQTELGAMVDEIGFGWPDKPGPTRKWDPLPACDSGGTSVAVAGLAAATDSDCPPLPPEESWPSEQILIILKTALHEIPKVGGILGGIAELFWPSGGDDVSAIIDRTLDCTVQMNAYDALIGLRRALSVTEGYFHSKNAWVQDCGLEDVPSDQWPTIIAKSIGTCKDTTQALQGVWSTKQNEFTYNRMYFQTKYEDQQLKLLPLFAQYETLYMSFLQEGILMKPAWIASGIGEVTADIPGGLMANELNPTYVAVDSTLEDEDTKEKLPDRGIAYLDNIYKIGLAQQPAASKKDSYGNNIGWTLRNAWIRDKILNIMDFRDTWKYMDPRAYPDGVPGGVKLTRMIYSDPIGGSPDTSAIGVMPILPSNVPDPLKEISVWTRRTRSDNLRISSVQATSPPLLGPAQSGAITGDTAQQQNHTHYYNLSALGPISQVKGNTCPIWVVSNLTFVWARDGSESYQGASDRNCPGWDASFAYDGEVLATAQVTDTYWWDQDNDVAEAVVFGFRHADSFNPAGEVIGVHSGKCIRLPSFANGTQAEIYVCNRPPSSDQIWTYDPVLQQISVTNPTEYSDNNPTNLSPCYETADGRLDCSSGVPSGKHCLDTKDGRTAVGTPVVINACDDGALTTPWRVTGAFTPVITTSPHSGTYAAHLGSSSLFNGNSTLTQTVTVPSGTSALSYWYQPHCTGSITNDQIQMQIRSTSDSDTPLANVMNVCSNSGVWTNVTFDTSAFAGQTVVLWFNVRQDYLGNPTYFLLDDVAVTGSTAPDVVRNGGFETGDFTFGKSSQRWTIDAVGAGIAKITHVKSGLVLDVHNNSTANGTPLQLYYYSSGNTAQQWRAHDPLTGEIHGVGSGRCVDVPDYSTTPGTQVQIYDCHGNEAQQWTYDPTSKELIYTYAMARGASQPMCLEARGGGTAPDTPVQINICTGAIEQRWTLHGNGDTITNDKSGLPLSVPHGYTANNTKLNLDTANGAMMQQWSRTSSQGGALHAVGAGKCLDSLLSTGGDTRVVINGCTNPPSVRQTWIYHTITQTFTFDTGIGPQCLDAAGTSVVINDCNGEASQRWSPDFRYYTITNVASGLVLDVSGGGTADGTAVQLTPLQLDDQGMPIPTSSQTWVWSLN